MRAIALITMFGLTSVCWTATPAAPVRHPASILDRNCHIAEKRLLLRNLAFPIPIVCEIIDSDVPFPGDFPPPDYQLPSTDSHRAQTSTSSPPPLNTTTPTPRHPRSPSAR